jgi:predicted outer membrane protein
MITGKLIRIEGALIASLALLGASVGAQPAPVDIGGTNAPAGQRGPAHFLHEATRGNSMEAALGEVGVRKAQSPNLKAFSEQVQRDHLKLNEELKPIDKQFGLAVDEPLPKRDVKELARIEKENGAKFDQELATDFLKEHQKAVNQYEHALQQNLPVDVRQYAQTTLPMLQQHLQQAESIARDVGVSQTTISAITSEANPEMGGTGTAQEPQPGFGAGQKNEKGAGARQLEQQPPLQPK